MPFKEAIRDAPSTSIETPDEKPVVRFRYKRELEMQVRFGRDEALPWHRLMIDDARGFEHGANHDGLRTRCDEAMKQYTPYATREESYDGNLCLAGCFGPGEIRVAAERRRKQSAERRASLAAEETEYASRESQRLAQLEEDRERVRVARERAERLQREEAERERADTQDEEE